MSKIRQQNVHTESNRRRPFFFKGRRVTSQELEENGAPKRGILSFQQTGLPPETGIGRHSTGNAAKRAKSSAERES